MELLFNFLGSVLGPSAAFRWGILNGYKQFACLAQLKFLVLLGFLLYKIVVLVKTNLYIENETTHAPTT